MHYAALTPSLLNIVEACSARVVGGGAEGGREGSSGEILCFSGLRKASPQEIFTSNYKARERQLFVRAFKTLIDKTEQGWSPLVWG